MKYIIRFFSEEVVFALPTPSITTDWIKEIIQQERCTHARINFIFCSDQYLRDKNFQYLQHDSFTDVLTFDYADNPSPLVVEGDIYISIDRVHDNAKHWKQPFIKELHTVIVHGILHLLGYKDDTLAQKAVMRQKEAAFVTPILLETIHEALLTKK